MTNEKSKNLIMSMALGLKPNEELLGQLFEGSDCFCVWAVMYNDGESSAGDIHVFVEEAFSENVGTVFWDAYEASIFVAFGRRSKELIDNSLESVCERVFSENGKTLCVVSDGEVFSDVHEITSRIKKCAELINEIKSNSEAMGPGVKFFDTSAVLSTMVSPADIREILRLFEKGKFTELAGEIDNRVEEIRKNNAAVNTGIQPTSIKRFFVELITFAAHTAYDYGVDVDNILGYEDPYRVIFSMDETPDIKAWFMSSCEKLYAACQKTVAQDKNNLISAVEKYISDNVSRSDFGVAEIAETFKLSPAYLSNCYSTARGSTIIKYINQLRLENACRYLEQTDEPINEICKKTGYSSINYFYSCFRKKFGITPADYRKINKMSN